MPVLRCGVSDHKEAEMAVSIVLILGIVAAAVLVIGMLAAAVFLIVRLTKDR